MLALNYGIVCYLRKPVNEQHPNECLKKIHAPACMAGKVN
jgi:YesN/AraC family two-component response regulator